MKERVVINIKKVTISRIMAKKVGESTLKRKIADDIYKVSTL